LGGRQTGGRDERETEIRGRQTGRQRRAERAEETEIRGDRQGRQINRDDQRCSACSAV
jgi:hypothetical protein